VSSSKITIKDVAKRAKVSIATVSRFFSNPSALKEKNRKIVEKAVAELNYQPFIFARRLAGGRLKTFGLIIPGYEGIFYSFYAWEIIRGIALSLDRDGIDLHLHIFWNKDSFNSSLVEGVIFADVIGNEKQLKRLIKQNLPIVVINNKFEDDKVSFVAVDNFKGGFEATEFLINHGHKKIAHLAGDLKTQAACERLDGFREALKKNGLKVNEDYIKVTDFSPRLAHERLEELFHSPIDLVETEVIDNPYFKEAVEESKVPLYGIP